jgi:hypothetical protein
MLTSQLDSGAPIFITNKKVIVSTQLVDTLITQEEAYT